MRKTILFALLIFNTIALFAQTAPITPPVTTVRPTTVNSAPASKPNPNNPFARPDKDKAAMLPGNTISDNIANMKTFTKFYNALQIAGLTETFKSAGPITLFIPDDDAFEKMPKGKLDTLLRTDHRPELIAFITYHAIPGKITSGNIARQINKHKNTATFTTLSGGKLTAKINPDRTIVLIDEGGKECTVSQSNITQSNGMLFVIDGVLAPKNRLF